MDIEEQIIGLLKKKEVLSAEEETEVFQYYEKNTSIEVRNMIVEKNMGLVKKASISYLNLGIEQEELVQEGMFGLIKAVERYDWKKGVRFSTYAMNWIYQSMGRYIANNAQEIRYPVHVMTAINRIKKIKKQYELENGHAPDFKYLAEKSGISEEKIKAYEQLSSMNKVSSLNQKVGYGDDKDIELGMLCKDEKSEKPFEEKNTEIDLEKAKEMMEDILSQKEMDILSKRFGLFGYKPQTLEEIGQEMDLSRERIRQLEKRAQLKLRHSYRLRKELADYYFPKKKENWDFPSKKERHRRCV